MTDLGIRPAGFRLPDATHVGRVTLAVASLDRSLAFYRDFVGLHEIAAGGEAGGRWSRLGAQDSRTVLLELREQPGARPVPRRGLLGLYHFALLLPDRPSLGRFVKHLQRHQFPAGAADHVFSEALYLTDPDGLQMEVYADRPRASWPSLNGELVSGVDPLDFHGLIEAAGDGEWTGVPQGAVIGHVHFYVGDLARADAFYHSALGLDKTIWTFPGALFVSAGGYHHHVGLNIWAAGSPPASERDARLLQWTLVLPDRPSIDRVADSLAAAGDAVSRGDTVSATDEWGIRVEFEEPGSA
jgi:catechol 2,3-dioxygenase